ncbi:hypothetical protein [Halomicrococcus sp. NG-SE-24]|uniref:hypothetical protein n=1 Tax=Halomicrococcus sp. NG-SE-24 TaxID=3436928 RepID=UPI003D9511BF
MANPELRWHPLVYGVWTIALTTVFTLVMGLVCFLVLAWSLSLDTPLGKFAFSSIFGISVYQSQIFLKERHPQAPDSLPNKTEMLIVMTALLYYNILVFTGLQGGLFITRSGYPSFGLMFALLYPVWDVRTTNRMLPLSVGGIVAFGLSILQAVGLISGVVLAELCGFEMRPLRYVYVRTLTQPN